MNKELGIANSFQEHGVTEELYLAHKDAIAHNAVLDACTPEIPVKWMMNSWAAFWNALTTERKSLSDW